MKAISSATPPPIRSRSKRPMPPKPWPRPPNSRPPSRPPSMNPPIAPMKPPKGLGRGAIGAGDTGPGVAGRGAVGSGRAGAESEREPRLPVLVPLPARAQADPASIRTKDVRIVSVSATSIRLCMMSPSSYAGPSLESSGPGSGARGPWPGTGCPYRHHTAQGNPVPGHSREELIGTDAPAGLEPEPGNTAAQQRSRDQQHLARRLPPLESTMGLSGVLQRVLELHAEAKLAVTDPAQHLAGAPLDVLARRGVMAETGTRQVERALGVEDLGIDLTDGPARLAVERDKPAGSQRVEALVPGGLADAVVHDLHTLAAGDPLDLGLEVLPRVDDRVVRAGVTGELGLLVGGDGADHARPAHLRDLAEQQSNASRRRVNQAGIALAQIVRGARKVVRGHAL